MRLLTDMCNETQKKYETWSRQRLRRKNTRQVQS